MPTQLPPRPTWSARRLLKCVGYSHGAAVAPAGESFTRDAKLPTEAPAPSPSINDLSEDVLELILSHLQRSMPRKLEQATFYAVAGVNRTWRRIAVPLLLSDHWDFTQPLQPSMLMRLCPKPLPDGGLLRCCVLREVLRPAGLRSPGHRFCMFLGADVLLPDNKLMLCAEQHSKGHYTIATSRHTASDAVAQLGGNLLSSSYSLAPNSASPWVHKALQDYHATAADGSSGGAASLSSSSSSRRDKAPLLARVGYQMQMTGIMLPRRMKVELPLPDEPRHIQSSESPRSSKHQVPPVDLDDVPPADPLAFEQPSQPVADPAIDPMELYRMAAAHTRRSSSSGGSDRSRASSGGGASSAVGGVGSSDGGNSSRSTSAGGSSSTAGSSARSAGGGGAATALSVQLESKAPTWNEESRCWCLDFQGRVKVPSVKNMQLMCSGDDHARVVLQFGKMDADTFSLDFNPCVMSALQAFSILLTHFDTKLNL